MSVRYSSFTQGFREEELLRLYSERNFGCPHTNPCTQEEAPRLFSRYFDTGATVRYIVVDLSGIRKVKLNIPHSYELRWHIIVKGKTRQRT